MDDEEAFRVALEGEDEGKTKAKLDQVGRPMFCVLVR